MQQTQTVNVSLSQMINFALRAEVTLILLMRPSHCKSLIHIYILQCLVKHHCIQPARILVCNSPWCFVYSHSPIQPLCKSAPWLGLTTCIPNPGWTAANEGPVPGDAEIISDSPLPPWNETESSFTGAGLPRALLSSGSREFCVGSGMQLKNLLQVTRILCDSSVEENVRSCPLCYSWVKDNWEFPVVLVRWHSASHSNSTPYPEWRGMVKTGFSTICEMININTGGCLFLGFLTCCCMLGLVVE